MNLAGLKQRAKRLYNRLTPAETIEDSKRKWDKLAEQNARYFVLSEYGEEVDEEQFRAAGKRDYQELVEGDVLLHERLGNFKNKNVLEIGCGLGRLTEFFADKFSYVIGIDISDEMVREASIRLAGRANIQFLATDGTTFPMPDASVDFVFSYIVFQHMPDTITVRANIREISRVLKPGGIAKIQLRGQEVAKGEWFYGPSFRADDLPGLFTGLPVKIIRTTGEGERYYWIIFVKH